MGAYQRPVACQFLNEDKERQNMLYQSQTRAALQRCAPQSEVHVFWRRGRQESRHTHRGKIDGLHSSAVHPLLEHSKGGAPRGAQTPAHAQKHAPSTKSGSCVSPSHCSTQQHMSATQQRTHHEAQNDVSKACMLCDMPGSRVSTAQEGRQLHTAQEGRQLHTAQEGRQLHAPQHSY
eukprot:1156636-Pelagomonas_calceolata.AAC.2